MELNSKLNGWVKKDLKERRDVLEETLNDEVNISADEIVGSSLAETSRKRRIENFDSEQKLFKITANKKSYTMQSPRTIVVPNTPVIDDDKLCAITRKADLCFIFNKRFATEETIKEYNIINAQYSEIR
ncbi:hypothetical protein INT48_001565 [Thamnidium elegans]|uniref:Uncharacterized protein n=1 Tax=Thamnidium elegans TaxID=101142 RepID=A0A8H7VT91_9FUNG|nr:hypothetical protein INT48_001565 [Thamnidium elegans]